jgi:hypothetical protein
MAFLSSWAGLLIGVLLYVALLAVGLLIAYNVIKAAVRNGTIEAYIKLRREKLYPPE